MIQLIYPNKLFLCGKPAEITQQLKELASQFRTVRELLDFYSSPSQSQS